MPRAPTPLAARCFSFVLSSYLHISSVPPVAAEAADQVDPALARGEQGREDGGRARGARPGQDEADDAADGDGQRGHLERPAAAGGASCGALHCNAVQCNAVQGSVGQCCCVTVL